MTRNYREPRLLLVDDEDDFLAVCSTALDRRGFEVVARRNPEEALELALNEHFDVVVLDVRMPRLDGIQLFDHLSQLKPELQVILVTGHGSVQQALETSRKGVFDYVNKPVDIFYLSDLCHLAAKETKRLKSKKRAHYWSEELLSPKVLIVDDDQELLDSLTPSMTRRNLSVSTCRTGEEALELIRRQCFDVVVLDLVLPRMSGLEVLSAIKSEHPNVQVIILTGNPTISAGVHGITGGAFDFIAKPQDVDKLAAVIRKAYGKKREIDQEYVEEMISEMISKFPT